MPATFPKTRLLLLGAALVGAALATLPGRGFAQAPTYTLTRLTTDDGLPDVTVYDVARDTAGWLYFATASGLYRYDGVDFVAVPAPGARQRDVHNLFTGPAGELYVQNFRRQVFHLRDDTLRIHADLGPEGREFVSVAALASGMLLRSHADLRRVDYASAGPTPPARTLDAEGCRYGGVKRFGPGTALVLGRTNEVVATWGGDSLVAFPLRPGRRYLANVELDGGRVLVEREGRRLYLRDGHGRDLARGLPDLPSVLTWRDALPDAAGALVVATNKGVYRLTDGEWALLAPGDASALLPDGGGGYWVTTLDRGVLRLTPRRYEEYELSTLDNSLLDVAVDDGGRVYGVNRAFQLYRLGPRPELVTTTQIERAVYHRPDGDLGFGHTVRVRPDGTPEPLSNRRASLLKVVKSIAPMGDDRYAYAGNEGLLVYDAREDAFAKLYPGRCSRVAYDSIARVGVSTCWGGVFRFGPATPTGPASTEGVPTVTLAQSDYALERLDFPAPDPTEVVRYGDRFAIGTSDRGLWLGPATGTGESPAGGSTESSEFAAAASATGRRIGSLAAAGEELWVTSEAGLSRCVPGEDGGLACVPFPLPGAYARRVPLVARVRGDSVYVLFSGALLRLARHAETTSSEVPPPPHLVDLRVGSREVAEGVADTGDATPLRLSAGEEAIAFGLRAPSYPVGGAPDFRYRLGGEGRPWQRVNGDAPAVALASLPAGDHVLEVALAGADAPVRRLRLRARHPWYRHPGSYVAATALAALALGLAYARRARRRQREAELRGELRRTKLAAIAAQMNPHFVFNALHSVQEFTLSRDVEQANAYLTRFARLMRLTLDLSRADYVTVERELEAMRLYAGLEARRFDGLVTAVVSVDAAVSPHARIPPLLVQPHLENAFKHGMAARTAPGGHIDVHYAPTADPRLLEVTVTDNGCGRATARRRRRARPGGGFGASAVDERMTLLREVEDAEVSVRVEDLRDDAGAPAGTRVVLRVPVYAPTPLPLSAPSPTPHELSSRPPLGTPVNTSLP